MAESDFHIFRTGFNARSIVARQIRLEVERWM
jgi:hypothetical protein